MEHISELISKALTHEPEPIKTGFKFLDEAIGGYYPGEVTMIGGWENSGKSSFIITQLNHIAVDQKIPTLLVLDNMKFDVFIAMMASYYCCIAAKDIHSILYSPLLRDKIEQYLNKLRESPLYIIDSYSLDSDDIDYCVMEKTIKEKGVKIMFYDEATSFCPAHENTVVYKLKHLSMQCDIPIVVVCCIWNDFDGTLRSRLSLSSFSRFAGYHGADVVLGFLDLESHFIFTDEHGRNLRGRLGIDILKYKGLSEKCSFLISKNALHKRKETLEEAKKSILEMKEADDPHIKKLIEQLDLDIIDSIDYSEGEFSI